LFPQRPSYIYGMASINRTVWVLSLVSLLADVASEMLYPVIPVYLREVGFSVLLIGMLEGTVNFISGLTKGYFGKRSDELGLRLPFVKAGYGLSALSKPLLAVSALPLWIFFARSLDRLGKGLRTAARDALLSAQATPATRARIFGFHRSMDTLGAAIGPLLALLLLSLFPGRYSLLFLLAFIPGLLSVLLIFLLREKKQPQSSLKRRGFFSYFGYWKIAPPNYRRLVTGLLLFALFNSADVFLLLKTKEVTGSDTLTIGAYILYNAVFALAAYPLGRLADRIGIPTVFLSGLLVFALVYVLFALAASTWVIALAFVLYGLYAAATEGLSKAWIANTGRNSDTATALGLYSSGESIAALLASFIAGAVWTAFGSGAAFLLSAAAALAAWLFFRLRPEEENNP
jgi:MFS family permease